MRMNSSPIIAAVPKHVLKSSLLRKPVNLSARKELLDEARKLGLNLSRLFEEALDARLRESRVRHWQEENRAAIEAFGRYIERNGIFGDSEERGF
jgi:antitoxin CcdA